MKITLAEFSKSVGHLNQLPQDQLPQIAFAGRSNVGKSSLLNSLLNRKKLVHVSSTPGKTRTLNFFLINKKFYFVDLPGYGYAKVSKSVSSSWQALLEEYLRNAELLKGIVLLLDIRHPIMDADFQLIEWMHANNIQFILVGTKADKLSANKLRQMLTLHRTRLQQITNLDLLPYSSVSGIGKAELWSAISLWL